MFNHLSEYLKNNQQEIIIYGILSLLVVIAVAAMIIQINKYLYRKHYNFGRKHFESREFEQSIQELDIARKLAKRPLSRKKSDLENASFQLAQACVASSKWEDAIEALTECVDINPGKIKYPVSLVENYLRVGDDYRAREFLDKAFHLIPSGAVDEIRRERIHSIMRDAENTEIMEKLRRLRAPAAVSESENLDKLEILKSDFEGREFILKGLASSEKDYVNLAILYIRQYILEKNGSINEAEGESDQEEIGIRDLVPYLAKAKETLEMLEVNAESAKFYNILAFLSAQEGNPKLAEENYEKAITCDPQYAETYYDLGLLCFDELNDTERAIENFENAIQRDSELAKAHHNLALLLLASGRNIEEVKHHFEEAIRINSLFSDVYWDLAIMLAKRNFKEFLLG
uniref:Tetratricopeptide repeat-containing protein n=1 Tax=Candidatus Kentrum sp. SD TaxID=2126332 RepID=A0A451BKG4_9GAMM|nr:MAG: Tetratricopeptide repeat-containing protein [Candidatus Kentron sp. SD]